MFAATPTTAYSHRVYTYVALAMYDATIATWESKYFYDRPRPSELDHDLPTALPVPDSPSYPSEHAAAAQAAATVLAYFLPAEAQSFQTMAEEAGWSRVLAGLQYPSDYDAGLELGRKVAEQVIAQGGRGRLGRGLDRYRADRSVQVDGTNPGNVTAANWKPLLLSSPSQFRPAPPPACDSPQVRPRRNAVRTFPRTFATNYKAFYWQSPEGLNVWPYRYADKWIFEDGLDRNPPRAARVYALVAAVLFDAFIASQDGKFTYWYIRPHQLDPAIVPFFPVPTFPSYPSNHSTFSTAGPRCSRTCSRRVRISFAPSARRPAIRGSGPAFTTRWTTWQGCSSASRWPRCSSTGRKTTARSKAVWLYRPGAGRRASSSARVKRTLTTYGGSPAVQWPYVVVTKVPSGSSSSPG